MNALQIAQKIAEERKREYNKPSKFEIEQKQKEERIKKLEDEIVRVLDQFKAQPRFYYVYSEKPRCFTVHVSNNNQSMKIHVDKSKHSDNLVIYCKYFLSGWDDYGCWEIDQCHTSEISEPNLHLFEETFGKIMGNYL